jgi:hypothetical protein
MTSLRPEILIEGSYLYYDKGVNYSREDFRFIRMPETQSYQFYAEILSRIETGEFLKIVVRYEMTPQFAPQSVQIEKSLGTKYALETFRIDSSTMELVYTFQNSHSSHEFKRPVNSKQYLTSPAFCTTAAFTLTSKFEPHARTPVSLISTENEWNFETNPTIKVIYADLKSRDQTDFNVLGKSLPSSHLSLFESLSPHPSEAEPVELILSKHYSIPYQMNSGDLKIEVTKLKKIN